MPDLTMGAIESRFADIIWNNEPISSGQLAQESLRLLGWKKSTSFTVLRRLCEKGIFQNQKGTVTSLMSRDAFYAEKREKFVEDTFQGSLPAFLAAFSSRKNLTPEDVEYLRRMVDEYQEE